MFNVLFVCTGNIFRSLTAERSLRSRLSEHSGYAISSAGTRDLPDLFVREDVRVYLRQNGLDVSDHRRRTLSDEILDLADLIIAMNTDHKTYLQTSFQKNSVLFNEASGDGANPMPDVDDLFAPEDYHSQAAQKHIFSTIDHIIERTPVLADRLLKGWRFPQ